MLRSTLLFIHLASAIAVFIALGIESVALVHLRRATTSDASRSALADLGVARRIDGPAMLLLLVSGMWLSTVFWHWQGGWIRMGFLGLVLVGAIGGSMTGRAVRRLRRQGDDLPFEAVAREANGALRRSFLIRGALLAAVVFLMTVKPA